MRVEDVVGRCDERSDAEERVDSRDSIRSWHLSTREAAEANIPRSLTRSEAKEEEARELEEVLRRRTEADAK